MNVAELPTLGVGLGFREPLRTGIFLNQAEIDLLEITADHYIDAPPRKLDELALLSEQFVLVPHSLDLSLGSAEGVDGRYLDKLARLIEQVRPPWFSDHICFTRSGGVNIGHLGPVPFTDEALEVFVRNIARVRERIGVPLILENITSDVRFPSSRMTEGEFVTALLNESGCGMLLDVTNLYINATNLGYGWRQYLDSIPLERVVQVHFVGSHRHGGRLIDAHADATENEIWEIFAELCRRCEIRGAILERDENIPAIDDLIGELARARAIMKNASTERADAPRGVGTDVMKAPVEALP